MQVNSASCLLLGLCHQSSKVCQKYSIQNVRAIWRVFKCTTQNTQHCFSSDEIFIKGANPSTIIKTIKHQSCVSNSRILSNNCLTYSRIHLTNNYSLLYHALWSAETIYIYFLEFIQCFDWFNIFLACSSTNTSMKFHRIFTTYQRFLLWGLHLPCYDILQWNTWMNQQNKEVNKNNIHFYQHW